MPGYPESDCFRRIGHSLALAVPLAWHVYHLGTLTLYLARVTNLHRSLRSFCEPLHGPPRRADRSLCGDVKNVPKSEEKSDVLYNNFKYHRSKPKALIERYWADPRQDQGALMGDHITEWQQSHPLPAYARALQHKVQWPPCDPTRGVI